MDEKTRITHSQKVVVLGFEQACLSPELELLTTTNHKEKLVHRDVLKSCFYDQIK